jgi:Sec-independent protein translocase protein TatA
MAEAAVIAVVALLFLGPEKLPTVMRGLAKVYRQLSRLRTEFSKAVEDGLGPELRGLKPEMDKLKNLRVDIGKPLPRLLADKAKNAVLNPKPAKVTPPPQATMASRPPVAPKAPPAPAESPIDPGGGDGPPSAESA